VSYTQFAEFNIGTGAMSTRPPDPSALLAFVKKYPDGQMVKDAYGRLSGFYGRQGSKEDATKFFEGYTARFPQEVGATTGWVARIILDKEPLDKGIDLAKKAIELAQGRAVMMGWQNLGRLYLLKGDKDKAVEAADQIMKIVSAPIPSGTTEAIPMGGGPGGPGAGAPGAAQLYIDAGKPEKALAAYGPEFVKQNAKSGPMLSRYAQFWVLQGTNLDSALAAAKTVTELTPTAYGAFNTVAAIYQKMKNYGEALKAAEKALVLAPAQPAQIKEGIQRTIETIKAAAAEKK